MAKNLKKSPIEDIKEVVNKLEKSSNDEEAAIFLTKIIGILNPIVDKDPNYRQLRDHAYAVLTEDVLVANPTDGTGTAKSIIAKSFIDFFRRLNLTAK